MVVAESRYIAEDGCDLIDVEYEPLDPVPSMARADSADAPLVWEELGDNCAYEDHWEYGDVEGAFASAFRVVRETFSQHRYANVPMEGRGRGGALRAGQRAADVSRRPPRAPLPAPPAVPSARPA